MVLTAEALVARDLEATMVAYAEALRAHRDAINRLNVYPVPDGDTGTNMALTVESVVAALQAIGPPDPDPAAGGPEPTSRRPTAVGGPGTAGS
ncbi:MAG: hypothetical protein ACRD0J_06935, partial [Acidimicrobiales bacterium]